MALTVDIVVEGDEWAQFAGVEDLTRAAVDACLATVDADGPHVGELSVLLCNDVYMRELNRRFRGLDKATNVLSFPAPDGQGGDLEARVLGDIAIAYETVAREAREEKKTLADHYVHMIVHGLLHIAGYDHETSDEAEEMEDLERDILRRLAIPDPYAVSDLDSAAP